MALARGTRGAMAPQCYGLLLALLLSMDCHANTLSGTTTWPVLWLLIALVSALTTALLLRRRQHSSRHTLAPKGIYQSILQNSPSGMITINAEGTVVYCNPACEQLFAYRTGELLNKNIECLIPRNLRSEHQHKFANKNRQVLPLVIGKHRIVTGLRKDGSEFPIEIAISHHQDGRERLYSAAVRDVSERVEQEQQLREHERILSAFVQASDECVLIFDHGGKCLFANSAAEELIGASEQRLKGKHILDLSVQGYPGLEADRHYQTLRSSKSFKEEIQIDQRWFELYWYPLKDRQGLTDSTAICLRDVTSHKQIESELLLTKDRAEKASQSKSSFLSKVSHEFRTPLNSILGFTQLLLDDKALGATQRESVQMVHDSGDHLLQLVNDILDLTKIEAGVLDVPMRETDIGACIQECHAWASSIANQAGIDLEISLPDSLPMAISNAMRLKQVLLNLISNAIKYTRRGGSVIIEVTTVAEILTISVRDNGRGIREEQKNQVFKAFHRLDEQSNTEGVGIGLALSRELMHYLNGDIGFYSREDEGSEFWIKIPIIANSLQPIRKASRKSLPTVDFSKPTDGTAASKRILYVEDNRTNVHLVTTILQRYEAHQVDIADDCASAGKSIESTAYDLIILDLPDGNGLELYIRLREQGLLASSKVIALSADALSRTRKKCLDAGMQAFLSKPLEIANFLKVIREQLRASDERNRAEAI